MSAKTIATLSFMALLVVAPAFAQAPLHATIPFDFTVGNTRMAAGDYTVNFDIPGVVRVTRDDRKASCAVITMAVQARQTPTVGKLVFNKYGDSHFLSQLWRPGYDQGRELYKAKTELEYARNAGATQLASVRVASR